VLPRHRLRGLQ